RLIEVVESSGISVGEQVVQPFGVAAGLAERRLWQFDCAAREGVERPQLVAKSRCRRSDGEHRGERARKPDTEVRRRRMVAELLSVSVGAGRREAHHLSEIAERRDTGDDRDTVLETWVGGCE